MCLLTLTGLAIQNALCAACCYFRGRWSLSSWSYNNCLSPRDNETAIFWVRFAQAVGVFFAVLVALFGEQVKLWVNRIELRIEETETYDNFLNEMPQGNRILCHHLRVRNATPHRPVQNCRVWLVRVLEKGPDAQFQEHFKFAVPRLMRWAPYEYSPEHALFRTIRSSILEKHMSRRINLRSFTTVTKAVVFGPIVKLARPGGMCLGSQRIIT